MKQLIITIDPMGNITSRAEGFVGEECLKATEVLRKLGGNVKDEKTDDFYRTQGQQVTAGQG
jgi:hypothetical protein